VVLGPAAAYDPHRRIETEALGIVDVFIADQPAVDRLAEEGRQAVLRVLSGARAAQAGSGRARQCESVVDFAVGEESGVTGDS
jgi:hypothetical protein